MFQEKQDSHWVKKGITARRTRMIASEVREAGRGQITGLYRSRK